MRGANAGNTGDTGGRELWLSAVAVVCILGWAVPALLMLDRGFAVQDEGTYLLAYRFWHSNPYYLSGAQYVYGPLFEALGESISLLRLLRLGLVIAANATFAWCFLSWLRRQETARLPAPRPALLLLITASGGMTYLWSPLTPGYYGLTAASSLALVSLLIVTLRPGRSAALVPVLTGVVAVVLLLSRWPAVPLPALTVGVALWAQSRESPGAALRYAALVAGGVLGALVVVQVFMVPVDRLVATLLHVSSLSATGTHDLGYLMRTAVRSTSRLLLAAALTAAPLLLGLVGARRARSSRAVTWWLVGACVVTVVVVTALSGWRGGGAHGGGIIAVVLGSLIVAFIAASALHSGPLPGGTSGRLLAVVLVLAPALQGAGSDVPPLYLAAECLAMGVALVLLFTARPNCPPVTSRAALIYLALTVVAVAMIAGTTTAMSPFKTASLSRDTVLVPQLGVRVDGATAAQYAALAAALRPYVVKGRTPMLTLDQLAGLTYLLGGVPAGSPWTSAGTPGATAGILALACRNGDVASAPVLVIDRPVDPALQRALANCGFDYPAGYRPVPVAGGPPGLRVLVPRTSR